MAEPDFRPEDVPIKPASTVVLVRDGRAGPEALLVRRSSKLVFHGGSWVFPGGRIDDEDRHPADGEDAEPAARRAAVREVFEEVDLHIEAGNLVYHSHWTTPMGRPRRFATWFYAAQAPSGEGSDVNVDGAEIHDHEWMTPHDALAKQRAGEIELPGPTFVTLSGLAVHRDVDSFLAHTDRMPSPVFVPYLRRSDAGQWSIYEGDICYQDDTVPLDTPGPRHRLTMIDGNWRYERSDG